MQKGRHRIKSGCFVVLHPHPFEFPLREMAQPIQPGKSLRHMSIYASFLRIEPRFAPLILRIVHLAGACPSENRGSFYEAAPDGTCFVCLRVYKNEWGNEDGPKVTVFDSLPFQQRLIH
jgi:hypothetical protein